MDVPVASKTSHREGIRDLTPQALRSGQAGWLALQAGLPRAARRRWRRRQASTPEKVLSTHPMAKITGTSFLHLFRNRHLPRPRDHRRKSRPVRDRLRPAGGFCESRAQSEPLRATSGWPSRPCSYCILVGIIVLTACHPDRSFPFQQGMGSGVEGPAVFSKLDKVWDLYSLRSNEPCSARSAKCIRRTGPRLRPNCRLQLFAAVRTPGLVFTLALAWITNRVQRSEESN